MSDVLKFEDIKAWDEKTILSKVADLRRELFSLKMRKTTVGIEKPHEIKIIKKNIARLMTAKNGQSR